MNFSYQDSLKDRDQSIINNWYIACLSSELKSKPLKSILYDTSYVLFRNKHGEAACFQDRCIHRNAQLSEGQVVNGKLICPYHGWSYESTGQVCEIPSEGPDSKVKLSSLCARALPLCERDGVVWIYLGDDLSKAQLPTWNFPHYKESGWQHYFMLTDFEGEVTNLVENFMDVAHTVYVHQRWFRDRAMVKVPATISVENGAVNVTYKQENDQFSLGARLLVNPGNQKMQHTDKFIYPNITRVDYQFGDQSHFIINSQCTPVSTLKSRVYTYIAYKIPRFSRLVKPAIQFYTRKVIEQDVKIMRNQSGTFKETKEQVFRSTPADEVHLAIERLRDQGAKGLDVSSITSHKDIEFWI